MKNTILLFIGLLFWATSYGQKQLITDPNAQVRKLSSSFHAIVVSNAINLYLSQGNEEAVALSAADKNDIDKIVTQVDNGVLKIFVQNKGMFGWGWKDKKWKAYVSFKDLDRIVASGASNVFIEGGLNANKLAIHLSGASDLKGALKADDLDIHVSGASDASLEGNTSTASIEASGASNIKAYGLITEKCKVQASGASDIKITVNKELEAYISGASGIQYKGSAVISSMHSSGASSVSKRD